MEARRRRAVSASNNNNCKVSTACASVSGANTYVLQHVRNVAIEPVEVTCCVCKSALHDPSYRRTINPANSSNSKIRDFFLKNICSPNYCFSEDSQYFVCQLTCYRKLEKAEKLQDNLDSLLASRASSTLRKLFRAT